MSEINAVKVTPELKAMVEQVAVKCGLGVSEVLRAVALGIRHNRPVIQIKMDERITKAGSALLPVRGLALPDDCPVRRFREMLYVRCREELARPDKKRTVPAAREGVDYNVPSALAAAKLGW